MEREIDYVFRNNYSLRNKYSFLAGRLSRNIEGKDATLDVATLVGHEASRESGKPIIDLNMAFKASLAVSKSVLSSTDSPELAKALDDILKAYEGHLQSSEFGLSEKIVEFVRKRDSLKSRIVAAPGVKTKLRNGFLKVAAGIRNMQVNAKSREYDSQGHLRRVAEAYEEVCKGAINPYLGWYNFEVPKLRFDIVERELLLIQDVARKLGFDESEFSKLLRDANCLSYRVENRELLKRSELNRVLKANPIKDFTEFPK